MSRMRKRLVLVGAATAVVAMVAIVAFLHTRLRFPVVADPTRLHADCVKLIERHPAGVPLHPDHWPESVRELNPVAVLPAGPNYLYLSLGSSGDVGYGYLVTVLESVPFQAHTEVGEEVHPGVYKLYWPRHWGEEKFLKPGPRANRDTTGP